MPRKDPTLFLLVLGTLLMYGSVTIGINFGNYVRLGSLGAGFLCIVATLWFVGLRAFISTHNLIWLLYFAILAFNSVAHDHSFIYSNQQIIFHLVIIGLFLIGYTLGQNRNRFARLTLSDTTISIFSGLFIFFNQGFHRFFLYSARFHQGRGYILDKLNPIGVAYGFAVLTLTFICLFIFAKRTHAKILAISACGFSFMSMITTQSRGAFIWLLLTVSILAFSKRRDILAGLTKAGFLLKTTLAIAALAFVLFNITRSEDFQQAYTSLQNRIDRIQLFTSDEDNLHDAATEARVLIIQRTFELLPRWFLRGMPDIGGYPHNIFLELFERFGLLGLPLVFVFIRMPFHALRISASNKFEVSQLETFVFIVLLFCFFQGMTSLSLQMNRFLFFGLGYTSGMLASLKSPANAQFKAHQPMRQQGYALTNTHIPAS